MLMTPGPTPIPEKVNQRMAEGMIGHRSGDFSELMRRIKPKIKDVFGTKDDVAILSSSGTSSLEAAMVNLAAKDENVVVIVSGAFGARFEAIAKTYPYNVHTYEVEWGEAADPADFKDFLNSLDDVKVVVSQACETSTAVLHPVTELGEIVKDYDEEALFIVDGVSSVGGMKFNMAESKIDCLISGSQKALMLPPGLAFVAMNQNARQKMKDNDLPRFYLDLNQYFDSLDKDTTPFTPAVSLIQGLEAVLDSVAEEGLENVYDRHAKMRDMLRAGLRALDLELLVEDEYASPTVTAFKSTSDELSHIKDELKNNFGITIAGGQKHLKGQILRIGHMGYMFPSDIIVVLGALEGILSKYRQNDYYGKAIKEAQEVFFNDL
ncbi:pyridoxal-phosphate-dependent aminotransferase family protein [Salinicoccus halitifaciens]|nr:alanine--glyoxylate aminotransferase family protein [Salinicoccus halitifaciens]MCD2138470.1 alanine--glyoxylate aminotransferase family protein [Salinicoccus halitifaciens]